MVRRKAAAHAVAPHAVGARLQCTRSDGQPPCARAPICTRRAHARSPAPIAPQLRRLLLRRRVHASRRCRTGVCEVLERREDSGGNGGYEYYVHYTDLNRRLDEWVSHGRLAPVERSANAARKRLRHELQALQPARVLPVGEPDGPDGLDHVTLKEHEAATKVKNVGAVVLGRWRMEAWYYSPLICLGNVRAAARRATRERCARAASPELPRDALPTSRAVDRRVRRAAHVRVLPARRERRERARSALGVLQRAAPAGR